MNATGNFASNNQHRLIGQVPYSCIMELNLMSRYPAKDPRVGVEVWAVGSLVVRALDSRPEGLGSMPDATKYPPSAHGERAH
ncbi:hypothetical protein TNCV_4766961 [Trichonephila clavipes]|nr:hypothetical protein TNCV_4766961 [Trichonephila clavipes]